MIDWFKSVNQPTFSKIWLALSIIGNVGLLGFFKYADFFLATINNIFQQDLSLLNVALPIGISFYTFQTMSYSFDIYRGEAPVQKNMITFATYVALFPQLIAGPIVRYQTIADELENRTESFELFWSGTRKFLIGLGKKVLIANNIGLLWSQIEAMNLATLPVLTSWLGIIAFAFQIYFDFSGYSDMAIGLGRIFGFHFLENFNYPYMSRSITEFWRRWHISLGTWFKEYLYIPLGGNRKGLAKQARNILMVWILTGIWHGASWNFALWGLYFGVFLLFEKIFLLHWLKKLPSGLQRVYTLSLVLFSWILFSFEKMEDGLLFLGSLFGTSKVLYDGTSLYLLYTHTLLLCICMIGSTDFPKKVILKWKSRYSSTSYFLGSIELLFLLLIFFLSTAYLVDQSYNPFLYFRF
ncbi:MBOAT family protein [Jeotgalibaca sp. MA1X17-3]|uniref:MBOAT family O-acyltransferase n=1 Tax=Jeotgalibaca sp. MA1X17-3 TaxID=2908211 RepID=UPI001F2046F2|nr:MBOAT family O-acyltransferase [Jeotgalibaca sp. MA1X17-3]UJF15403.1 MBOAT family protein [Jeotgalibaca sp. MA1X17-3]